MRRLVTESAVQVPRNRDSLAILLSLLGSACVAALVAQGLDLGAGLLIAAAFWTVVGTVFADTEDPQARRRKRREQWPQYE